MRYTKSALGLLNNQYKSILKKCLMINLGIFAYMGAANAETEITAEYLNSVTHFNDRVVWEQVDSAGANTVQIGDKFFKYTYTQPSAYSNAPARLADTDITADAVTDKVFDGFASTGGCGGAVYNSVDNSDVSITSDFLNNSAAASTSSNHYGNAVYNVGTYTTHAKLGNISGVFINNSITETSGGGTLSGGVIENAYADIGDITADFIANVNLGNGNSFGGVIFNSGATIGNISGSFIGNELTSGSIHTLSGGIIRNTDANIGNISADFVGNHIQKGNDADQLFGGLINNEGDAEIGKISGNFLYNEVTTGNISYLFGGLIYNGSYGGSPSPIGEISGNFEYNTVKGNAYLLYGGLIANYCGKSLGNISGDYLNNTVSAEGGAYTIGLIYIDSKAGDITGDFKNNTVGNADIVYGGIVNDGGVINSITGSTFENNVARGTSAVIGGALVNDGVITNGLINTKFIGNSAIATSANGGANGGALYTGSDLKIAADGSIDDGISTFKGNYYQIAGGEKKYEAIYVDGAANTLTLEAKNGGIINMYDYINGSTGYDTNITGDDTGTVNLYNDIKNSDVSVEKVNISTADGKIHDYSMLSLTAAADAKWKIDINTKDKTVDNISTGDNATSGGTMTINELNYVESSQSDITDGFKVQVLKTQGDETAADLQLALSDELKEKFVISQKEDTVVDEVTADTKWSDEFKKTGAITTTSGQYGLATTDTLNDSIGVTTSADTEQVDEKLGDTLMLVNTAQLAEKNFTAAKASDVYKAEDDLGTTYGKLTIQGVAEGEQKSTIDLNGHDGFVVAEGATVALNDVKLAGSDTKAEIEIADGGKMSLQNADISGVNLNVEGELDVANNKVSAQKAAFGKASTLKLLVNNIKDDHGAFKADSFDIAEGATLDVTFGQNPLSGEKTGEVALLSLSDGSDINNNNFTDSFHNNMYKFTRKDDKSGIYGVYQTKTAEEISRENGGTKTNQGAAAAWVDGNSFTNVTAAEIADSLAGLAQNDGAGFNDALTALSPNDDGMVQALAADITDRLLLTIDNHLIEEAKKEGLASGDGGKTRGYPDLSGVKTWVKAYYGKAKLQRRADIYGFDTDSVGFIAGVDKKLTSSIKAGFGMQYDDTDIDAFRRDVDAKTLLGFVYGEYRPSNWFVNTAIGYGVTDYDEDKTVAAKKVAAHYKAEIYSVQGLTGYTFKYFTPEIGARYYKIKRHGYIDSALQDVSGENMDILRATAGVKAQKTYGMFKPHAYLGVLYDIVSDRDNAFVSLGNGASYTVHGKRLPRFGVELGAGVAAQVTNNLELGLGYEAKFRKDFQDHSGIATVKYEF